MSLEIKIKFKATKQTNNELPNKECESKTSGK